MPWCTHSSCCHHCESLWIMYDNALMEKYALSHLLFIWKCGFTILLNTLEPEGKTWDSVGPGSLRTVHPHLCFKKRHLSSVLLLDTHLAPAQSSSYQGIPAAATLQLGLTGLRPEFSPPGWNSSLEEIISVQEWTARL